MVPEASLERAGAGLAPKGEGWFVLNAREARWLEGVFGAYTRFEGDDRFPQLGINIGVLQPGQPACWYHGEDEQEVYPASELAQRHRAGVEKEAAPERRAYAGLPPDENVEFQGAWLP